MKISEFDIYQTALDNPIVRNAIKFFDSGAYNWTEAMMLAVKCLSEANKELSDELIKERWNKTGEKATIDALHTSIDTLADQYENQGRIAEAKEVRRLINE